MKKLFLGMAAVALFFTACDDNESTSIQEQEIDMSDFYVYTDADVDEAARSAQGKDKSKACASMTVLNRQLNENPGLAKKMYDIEHHTRRFIAGKKPDGVGNGGGGNGGSGGGGGTDPVGDGLGTINIPVIVHVVMPDPSVVTPKQISDQIDVLNEDFRKTNNDISQLPSEFSDLDADSEIEFTDARTINHPDSRTSWGTNDAVKVAYPPITPLTHLNIWVCNIGGGILGYAQFPGGSSATDGIVLLYSSLPGGSAAPYNKGRTATHEVGHYLNLRHIWGDGRCKRDDFVADTPSSDGPNFGCPSYPTVNCRSNDMTMNYMDYTDDACMYMFSEGQKTRMRAIFTPGGDRASFIVN